MTNGFARYSAQSLCDEGPRANEALALRCVNRMLADADDARGRNQALFRNHQLWTVFLRDLSLPGNALPEVLRQDLIRLAAWSMDYSNAALNRDLPLAPLIAVNGNVIDGLNGQPVSTAVREDARAETMVEMI